MTMQLVDKSIRIKAISKKKKFPQNLKKNWIFSITLRGVIEKKSITELWSKVRLTQTLRRERERERVSSRAARLVFGVVCSRFVVSKPSNLNRGSQCQFFSNFHIIHFLFALIFCYFHRLIFLKLNMFVKIWWWALGFNFLSFSLTTSPWFSFKSLSIQKIDESFSRILLGLWYRLNQSQSHQWWFQCHQWLLSNWKSNSIEFGLIFNMGPHTVRLCLRMKEEIEKSIENHSLWRVCVCVWMSVLDSFLSSSHLFCLFYSIESKTNLYICDLIVHLEKKRELK